MGSIGQSVSIIAYNVNTLRGAAAAVLLGVGPAVQASERRTGGAGARARDHFGLLLLRFRVTLPFSPFFLGLCSIRFALVPVFSGWLYAVIWGAMVFY